MLAYLNGGTWTEWIGQMMPLAGRMYRLPANAEAVWSDADLARYGLVRVAMPETPDGMRVASTTILDVAGTPTLNVTFEEVPVPVPTSISRPQCALEMLARAMITDAEAIAMATVGTPPALVAAMIEAMPTEAQTAATIGFARYNYDRGNPLLVSLMEGTGASAVDIDDFFRAAGAR